MPAREAFNRRERAANGGDRGPVAEILSAAKDLQQLNNPEQGWRRGAESNRRIKVLQTSPLPLGYRADVSDDKPPLARRVLVRVSLTGVMLRGFSREASGVRWRNARHCARDSSRLMRPGMTPNKQFKRISAVQQACCFRAVHWQSPSQRREPIRRNRGHWDEGRRPSTPS